MKKIRKTFVRKSASAIGYCLTKKTKQKDLQSLLARLRPMTPEKGLIRIGPDDDGGYVVPNNLDGIQACYSPGVSTECRFDNFSCAHRVRLDISSMPWLVLNEMLVAGSLLAEERVSTRTG